MVITNSAKTDGRIHRIISATNIMLACTSLSLSLSHSSSLSKMLVSFTEEVSTFLEKKLPFAPTSKELWSWILMMNLCLPLSLLDLDRNQQNTTQQEWKQSSLTLGLLLYASLYL